MAFIAIRGQAWNSSVNWRLDGIGPIKQNIALAIDQRLLKRARSFAAGQATSVSAMLANELRRILDFRNSRSQCASEVHSPGVQLHEMPDQYRNVFGPLPQRRNVDWKYLHSVVQILAKRRMLDHGSQVAMRGGDQAYINFVSAVAAEPLKFLLLQNAQ